MGKTAFGVQNLETTFDSFAERDGFTPGLMIGQPSQKNDIILHVVSSFIPNESASSNENDVYKAFEDIDGELMNLQMKNITRFLPGGTYVLGIFIVGPGDIFKEKIKVQKVRSLINGINNVIKNNPFLCGNNPNMNLLMLHYCSKTKTYQCRAFDVSNTNLSMNPITWKFLDKPVSWIAIECNYMMDTVIPFYISDEKKNTFRKNIKDLVANYKHKLDYSNCGFNGFFKDHRTFNTLEDIRNELIRQTKELENRDIDESELSTYEHLNTLKGVMFQTLPESLDANSHIEETNTAGFMEYNGVIASKIFLTRSFTIEEAGEAVKEDLVRSLFARLELHCNALESDKPTTESTFHSLPRRVLAKHSSSGIMFSDYMFPDDTKEDISISIQENLNINIPPEHIIDFEPECDPQQYTNIENDTACNKPVLESNKNFSILIYSLIGAVIVLFFSIVLHFSL